jgi:hypothetical protein
LSAADKAHLDTLVSLLATNDGNSVVDTIGEILQIFSGYPEGADLATVLAGKQPLDGDLTSIANLSDPSGFLRKANTDLWVLDNTPITTETDPTVPAHVKSITSTNLNNWNTAYG